VPGVPAASGQINVAVKLPLLSAITVIVPLVKGVTAPLAHPLVTLAQLRL
jgi:hypothetical protein